jgi:hypothetical protein
MSACGSHDPTSLANPFVAHVNPALWRFVLVTFVAASVRVQGLFIV